MDISKLTSIELGTENCENLIIPQTAILNFDFNLKAPQTFTYANDETLEVTIAKTVNLTINIKSLLENFDNTSTLYEIMLDNKPLTLELLTAFLVDRRDIAVISINTTDGTSIDIYPLWNEFDDETNYYQTATLEGDNVNITVFKQ